MSKHKKESFFWTSYSDLMTSLFFIMLVLFVLVIVLLHNKISEQGATIEELKRITRIDEQFNPLIESGTFKYYPNSKKFVAKDLIGQEIFEPTKTEILEKFESVTINVGREVEKLLKQLSETNKDFSYQLVIEGNMANDWKNSIDKDHIWGYKTSYERALAVYLLWHNAEIDLRKYNTEILICGSGFNGLDRDPVEDNNKRFSIQIIPKISPKQE